MSGRKDLRDSLHREMRESKRPWSSEEIARSALRLVSDAARADKLVEAILGDDPRFRRQGSLWHVQSAPRFRLRRLLFLLADTPSRTPPEPDAPLFLRRYDPVTGVRSEIARVTIGGAGLDRAAAWLEECVPASLTASASRRILHHLEHYFALPAMSDRLLDLSSVLRLLDRNGASGPPAGRAVRAEPGDGMAQTEGEADPEERLESCRRALDRLLELRGEKSLEELEEEARQSRRGDPVDFSRYRFGPEVIDLLPARPGIYRFLDAGGHLLYVGKSRDLSRRVASYFRPLAPDHARRARLLAEMHDLEWETTPSELEALILEGESIRRDRPPYNQQIHVHDAGERVTAREADLAFVLCEGDPEEGSVFLLRDGKAWGRARLPLTRDPKSEARAASIVKSWFTGSIDPASGVVSIGEDEGLLVLRYLRLHRDRLDRLHAAESPGIEDAAKGLIDLACRERPAWEPWTVRSRVDRADGG